MKKNKLFRFKWMGILAALLFALVPQMRAQETDDLQEYLDQLAAQQTESQRMRSPRKGQEIAVPSGLTEVDLSKFSSYENRTKEVTVRTNVKFINGVISATSSYSGGTCLLKVYGGATVVLDATAGVNADAVGAKECLAAVGIYDGSTFYGCGDITGPKEVIEVISFNGGSIEEVGHWPCIAIYINGANDTFNYVSGILKGEISNPNGGTVNGLEGPTEAYAVLSTDGTTLSFYYDGKKNSRQGTIYTADQFGTTNQYPRWIPNSFSTVVFDDSFAEYDGVTSTYGWFLECTKLTTIVGIKNLNTKNVSSMNNMFAYCFSLTSLDLNNFSTTNLIDMGGMFYECNSLTSLDLSNFNTSNVTDMRTMFCNCSNLKSIDLSNFNTSSVTNMNYMFGYCRNLATINVGKGWNTINVSSSDNMFSGCTSLVGGDGTTYDPKYTDKTKAYAGIGGYLTMEGQETNTDDLQAFIDANGGAGGVVVVDLSKFQSVIRDATLNIGTGAHYRFINGTMDRSPKFNGTVMQICNGSTVNVGTDAVITGNDHSINYIIDDDYIGTTILLNGGTLNVTYGVVEGSFLGTGYSEDGNQIIDRLGNPIQTPAIQMTSPNDHFCLMDGTIYGPINCDISGADIRFEGGRIRGMGLRSNSTSSSRRKATPSGSREPYISTHSDIYINATTSENYTWGGEAPIYGGEVSPEDNFDAFDIRLYDKSVIHIQKEYKSGFHITIYDGEEGDVVMEGDGYTITMNDVNRMNAEVRNTERECYLKLKNNKLFICYNADDADDTDDLQDYLNSLEDTEDTMAGGIYTRKFRNTDWQSLYIPFAIDYEDWAEDFEVARFDGIDIIDSQPVLAATVMDSGKIRANTPYLIRAKAEGMSVLSVDYIETNPSVRSVSYSTDDATYTFTGNYEEMTGMFSAQQYRLQGGWLNVPTSDSESLPKFRWYMTIDGMQPTEAIRGLKVRINHEGDDATAIDEMVNDKLLNGKFYDLSGREIPNGSQGKGIYIMNNKKYIKR